MILKTACVSIYEPPCIVNATMKYRTAYDKVGQFVNDHIVKDTCSKLTASTVYMRYKYWCANNTSQGTRIAKRSDFEKEFIKTVLKVYYPNDGNVKESNVYKYIAYKDCTADSDTDDEEGEGASAEASSLDIHFKDWFKSTLTRDSESTDVFLTDAVTAAYISSCPAHFKQASNLRTEVGKLLRSELQAMKIETKRGDRVNGGQYTTFKGTSCRDEFRTVFTRCAM